MGPQHPLQIFKYSYKITGFSNKHDIWYTCRAHTDMHHTSTCATSRRACGCECPSDAACNFYFLITFTEFHLSVYVSICLCIYLSIYLHACLPIYLSQVGGADRRQNTNRSHLSPIYCSPLRSVSPVWFTDSSNERTTEHTVSFWTDVLDRTVAGTVSSLFFCF